MVIDMWTLNIQLCEAREYSILCQKGELYEFLMTATGCPDRSKVKKEVFRDVLFGKLDARGQVKDAFAHQWPSIHGAVMHVKRRHGYKVVAQSLQRLESSIVIDGVCRSLVREYPDVRFLTIHDSVITTAENVKLVRELMTQEFEHHGTKCSVS